MMDHLPHPNDPATPRLDPLLYYLDGVPYDWAGFHGFPARSGKEEFVQRLLGDVYFDEAFNVEDNLSFLQSWLFFGTVHEIFSVVGISLVASDFSKVDEETGRKLLSTKVLNSYAERWYIGFWSSTEDQRRAQAKVWDECLPTVCKAIQAVFDSKTYKDRSLSNSRHDRSLTSSVEIHAYEGPRIDAIMLSIGLVVEWIRQKLSILSSLSSFTIQCAFEKVPFDEKCLLGIFLYAGWCPADAIAFIRGETEDRTFEVLLYAGQMSRWHLGRDHSACGLHGCVSNSTFQGAEYQIRHGCEKKDCPSVKMIYSESTHSLLSSGLVPMIKFSSEGKIVADFRSPGSTHYVAISHVWSQGFGNTEGNVIPSCQIQFLYQCICSHESSRDELPWLWIDTFCVPVDKNLRKLAINKMRDVYQQADAVWVVDETLFGTDYDPNRPEDALMRIAYSPWATRLWTLQESRLAKHLFVQFKYRAVLMEELIASVSFKLDITSEPLLEVLKRHRGSDRFEDLSRIFFCSTATHQTMFATTKYYISHQSHEDQTALAKIANVLNAVQARTTSKAEDEPVCIAALWNLDVRKVLDTVPSQRMRVLFSMLDRVPMDVIFSHQARHPYPYGWLPKTFLRRLGQPQIPIGRAIIAFEDQSSLPIERSLGKITEKGLDGPMYGTLLNPLLYVDANGRWTINTENGNFLVTVRLGNGSANDLYVSETDGKRSLMMPSTVGVVFQDDVDDYNSSDPILGSLLDVDEDCINDEEDDGTIYCRYVCSLEFMRLKEDEQGTADTPAEQPPPLKLGWSWWCIG